MHWRIKTLSFVVLFGLASAVWPTSIPSSGASSQVGAPDIDPFGGWLGSAVVDPRPLHAALERQSAYRLAGEMEPAAGPPAGDPARPLGATSAGALAADLVRAGSGTEGSDPRRRLAGFDIDAILGKLRTSLFGAPPQGERMPVAAQPKVTLERVVSTPSEIKPLRLVSLTPGLGEPSLRPRARKLAPQPLVRPALRRPAAAAYRGPPRQKLRPFDAEALGIKVTPGSSADSLARILNDVSTRPPAAPGFGPALTSAQRTVPFESLLRGRPGLLPKD